MKHNLKCFTYYLRWNGKASEIVITFFSFKSSFHLRMSLLINPYFALQKTCEAEFLVLHFFQTVVCDEIVF